MRINSGKMVFLSNRMPFNLVNMEHQRVSWVPKGTMLMPIFFLINDINKNNSNAHKSSMIADDTSAMRHVNSENDVEDLQKDFDKIYDWQSQTNIVLQ